MGECPDCGVDRTGPGRCGCGSFAAPVAAPIKPPDPALRVRAWGELPAGQGDGNDYQQKPSLRQAQDEFEPRERPCARCGKVFETTPRRRMLCKVCFC